MQKANDLFTEYQNRAQREVNSYCVLRDKHPYHEFKEIRDTAQKYLILAHLWKSIIRKNNYNHEA